MFILYNLLLTLLAPIIKIIVWVRAKKGKEDPLRVQERYGIATLPRPQGQLIWFHAASVGESLSILTLIKALKHQWPQLNILITTTTVTSAKLMAEKLPAGCLHQYSPHDFSPWVRRFLHHWSPTLVFWVEQEIWPNVINQINRQRIPLWLINASITQKSFERWALIKGFAHTILMKFTGIFPKSQTDAHRLQLLGVSNICQIANLKYSAEALTYDDAALKVMTTSLNNRPFWLAASTHPGEEALIEQAHKRILQDFPNAVCILVPRHAVRAAAIAKDLALTSQQRSQVAPVLPETQIYIADTMGEMGLFYRMSKLAFIGASLVPIGGHNIIEPAKMGCVPIIGPYMHKFQDGADDFIAANACLTINNAQELALVIIKFLKDNSGLQEMVVNAQKLIAQQGNIIDTYVKLVNQNLQA